MGIVALDLPAAEASVELHIGTSATAVVKQATRLATVHQLPEVATHEVLGRIGGSLPGDGSEVGLEVEGGGSHGFLIGTSGRFLGGIVDISPTEGTVVGLGATEAGLPSLRIDVVLYHGELSNSPAEH